MKVLIVDDDKDILEMVKAFLEGEDYDIVTSRNGEDAYRMIKEEIPDLAIIDALIPGIHGFELCKKVKEDSSLQKPPKIMIMSSLYKGLKYQLEAARTYYADDYLVKPFTKEQLLSKIKELGF